MHLYEIARPERAVLVAWENRRGGHPEVQEFLRHPRIRTSFTDGRLALRLEPKLYDVVEADAAESYMAYSGNLYSLDFFLEVRRRLSKGGVFCTYVPTRRVADTVLAAFPFVVDIRLASLRIMLGAEEPLDVDVATLLERLKAPAVRRSFQSTPRGLELLQEVVNLVGALEITPIGPEMPRPTRDINTDLFPRDDSTGAPGPPLSARGAATPAPRGALDAPFRRGHRRAGA